MRPTPSLSQSLIDRALHAFEVPGLAIAVVQDNAVVLAQGYGARTSGNPERVDEHTLFAIGSISKSVTAACLALLVDEGKLGWDDRVTQYLPEFQLADPYVTREITVRDLLTHRSGLRDVSGGTLWYGSTYDREEVMRRLRYLRPVASFRSRFAYQNVMYLAAGEIVAAISGQSWDEFVNQRIFKPLGMTRSNTSVAALANTVNVATPHAGVGGEVQAVAYRDYDNVGPAASINASAVDMAQYIRLLLAGGCYHEQQLLSAAQIQEMWAAQMVIPIAAPPPPLATLAPQFMAYGLGWFVRDYRGHKLVLHSGGVDGMAALLTLVPAKGLGVVVLTNQEEVLAHPITYQLLDEYLELPHTDLLPAYLEVRAERLAKRQEAEAKRDAARIAGTSPTLGLEHYVGTYADELYGTATVSLEAEQLVLSFDASPAFTGELTHWHYDTFQITWRDPLIPKGLVTFPLNAHGAVAAMQFEQPKLLDADFAELDFRRVQPHPSVEGG